MAIVQNFLSAVTTTGAGSAKQCLDGPKTILVKLTGTGSISATVVIEVSNDGVEWISDVDSTLVMTGTTTVRAGLVMGVNWPFVRANVTAISGTGATLNATIGG